MLLWRRNVKCYHYSRNSSPVEPALIYRVILGFICLFLPYYISYAMGRFWDDYQQRNIKTSVVFNEAVLIATTASLATSVYLITPGQSSDSSLISQDYSLKISNSSEKMEIELEIFLDDITEVELYSYLTFSEFSKTPQLLVSRASGVVSPKLIIFSSKTRTVQRGNDLYNVHNEISSAFLPSKMSYVWTPELAIQNATNNLIRVDHCPKSTRWISGNLAGQSTMIRSIWEHRSNLQVYADPTMAEQLYRGAIQYIYFFIPILWFAVQLTDGLFESKAFPSVKKIENLPIIN